MGIPGAERDGNVYLALLESSQHVVLVHGNGKPRAQHGHTHEVDVHVLLREGHPALAGSRCHAAPVGVMAKDGSLDQRRVGNGKGNLVGICLRGRAKNVHRDELGRPFAICGNLAREVGTDALDGRDHGREGGRRLVNDLSPGSARGKEDARVVGGGVGVHRHLVEGLAHSREERGVCGLWRERRIGREYAEHGRHVGLDHAGALHEATHVHRDRAAVRLGRGTCKGGLLGVGVGGHDGAGGVMGRLGRCCPRVHNGGHALHIRLKGQLHADDARRGNQHVLLVAVKHLGDKGAGLLGAPQARLSCCCVGVAGVENHGTGVTGGGTRTAQKRFCVNVAAQTLVLSATTSAMSLRWGFLRKPAEMPAARMPAAAQTPPSQGAKPND